MQQRALWIFGYGSLMWNPGFAHDVARVARLEGYARSFCMRSVHHRGTPDRPGLVLALDRAAGAVCTGMAFRVTRGAEGETLRALRERELVSYAYKEERLPVILSDGSRVTALSYVIDRAHPQYAAALPLEEQARVIAAARGGRGSNRAYLEATQAHLARLGIRDDDMEWLVARVRELAGAGDRPEGGSGGRSGDQAP